MSKTFKSVLLLGPPGSGKGTLGRVLAAAGGHVHLSSGDIFRGLDPESDKGKLYYSYAGKGNLVPDEVTIDVWHGYVEGLIATNRYFIHKQLLLLDGIPRTLAQARLLQAHTDIVRVVYLHMPDQDKLVARMKKRAVLEKRQDDADETILRHRMRVYTEETEALIEYYPKELLVQVNADQKPLFVLRDVLHTLAPLL